MLISLAAVLQLTPKVVSPMPKMPITPVPVDSHQIFKFLHSRDQIRLNLIIKYGRRRQFLTLGVGIFCRSDWVCRWGLQGVRVSLILLLVLDLIMDAIISIALCHSEAPSPSCNGIFMSYAYTDGAQSPPNLKSDPTEEPYRFESTLTMLINGFEKLKSWRAIVGFHHIKYLGALPTNGTVPVNRTGLPMNVGVGVVFAGYPYTDLKTAIETAGDVTQMQVQVKVLGMQFGLASPNVPMPTKVSLVSDGFGCSKPTMQGELFQADAKSGLLLADFLLTAGHNGATSSDARDSKVVNDGVSTNDDASNAGCGIDAANEDSNVVFRCLSSDLQGFFQTGAVPFRSANGFRSDDVNSGTISVPKRKMGMLLDLQTRSKTPMASGTWVPMYTECVGDGKFSGKPAIRRSLSVGSRGRFIGYVSFFRFG